MSTLEIEPPKLSTPVRLTLALVLLLVITVGQLVLGVAFLAVYLITEGSPPTDAFNQLEQQPELLSSEVGLIIGVLAYAGAAAAVLTVAWGWPRLTGSTEGLSTWLALNPPANLNLWAVPPLTLLVLISAGLLVTSVLGPATVENQLLLVSSLRLQMLLFPVAGILGPIAEEIVFRGALYNAALGAPKPGQQMAARHALPFVISTVFFAVIHLPAGFEAPASIILILITSIYLTALRTYSGSVYPSIIGHITWNLFSVFGLVIGTYLAP